MPEIVTNTPELKTGEDTRTHGLGGVALIDVTAGEEPINPTVEKLFETGHLLVRALDSPRISVDSQRNPTLDYRVIDREVGELRDGDDGLSYASSTLLVPEKRVPTYKAFGFMFNGEKSAIHHVHTQDSGSHGQGDKFQATESDTQSLSELMVSVRETPTPTMNEVVGSFNLSNLVGIFAVKAPKPSAKIDAWLTQRHITEDTDIRLPIYMYDVDEGSLEKWEPNLEDIRELINSTYVSGSPAHTAYSHALLQFAT